MRTLATCSALLLPLLIAACAGDELPTDGSAALTSVTAADLSEIVERGQLRILRPRRESASHLPRQGHSLDFEVDLAENYAAHLGVEPVWIYLDSRDQLIPHLLEGRGDVIVANLTATEERKEQVAFTVPVAVVRELLVARSDDYYLRELADLDGRRIAARRSSSFWNTVGRLQEEHSGIELQLVDEDVDTEEIIYRVAVGQYDVTVADSNLVEACLEYRDDIRVAMDLTGDRPIAWAIRPDAEELRRSLDDFLTEAQLTDRGDELLLDDLPEIKKRRVLRLITRNMAATYFLWRGELMGFEYELMREFARRQGLRLEVMVPDAGVDPLLWLRQGRGDVVSAALTPTPERQRGGVVFTEPYNYVTQRVVARAGESGLQELADLDGRTFFVRRSSAYWDTLAELRNGGIELELRAAPEVEPTDEIIGKVATGEYDLTLSDNHVLAIEMSWRDDVQPVLDLKTGQSLAWAVRESNPELKLALDRFIGREYRGLHYNVIYEKYFRDEKTIRAHREGQNDDHGDISPYDGLVKKYAEQYGFDWRLIVAQMFQESRFDPRARSFAGARGLMQLLPRTAREFGFDDLEDPETGIHAGVQYLDWVRDRFDDVVSVRDRTWFALAAYNAGAGHVRHARRVAIQQGLDPNRWFGNVEHAMLLLSRPQYAQSSPHGYCRCSEPVRYVRDVRTRYNAYVEMAGS
jgi:membrane-bound lytic murein transglycosylase F